MVNLYLYICTPAINLTVTPRKNIYSARMFVSGRRSPLLTPLNRNQCRAHVLNRDTFAVHAAFPPAMIDTSRALGKGTKKTLPARPPWQIKLEKNSTCFSNG